MKLNKIKNTPSPIISINEFIQEISQIEPTSHHPETDNILKKYQAYFQSEKTLTEVCIGIANREHEEFNLYESLIGMTPDTSNSLLDNLTFYSRRINVICFMLTHIIGNKAHLIEVYFRYLPLLWKAVDKYFDSSASLFKFNEFKIELNQKTYMHIINLMEIINLHQEKYNEYLNMATDFSKTSYKDFLLEILENSVTLPLRYAEILSLNEKRDDCLKNIALCYFQLGLIQEKLPTDKYTFLNTTISTIEELALQRPPSKLAKTLEMLVLFSDEINLILEPFSSHLSQEANINTGSNDNIDEIKKSILTLIKNVSTLRNSTENTIEKRYLIGMTESGVEISLNKIIQIKPSSNSELNKEILQKAAELLLNWKFYFYVKNPDLINKKIIETFGQLYTKCISTTDSIKKYELPNLDKPTLTNTLVAINYTPIIKNILEMASRTPAIPKNTLYKEIIEKHKVYFNNSTFLKELIHYFEGSLEAALLRIKFSSLPFSENTSTNEYDTHTFIIRILTFLSSVNLPHYIETEKQIKFNTALFEALINNMFRIGNLFTNNVLPIGNNLFYVNDFLEYRLIIQHFFTLKTENASVIQKININKDPIFEIFCVELIYCELSYSTKSNAFSSHLISTTLKNLAHCENKLKKEVYESFKQKLSVFQKLLLDPNKEKNNMVDLLSTFLKDLTLAENKIIKKDNSADLSDLIFCLPNTTHFKEKKPDNLSIFNNLTLTVESFDQIYRYTDKKHISQFIICFIETFKDWDLFFASYAESDTFSEKMILEHIQLIIEKLKTIQINLLDSQNPDEKNLITSMEMLSIKDSHDIANDIIQTLATSNIMRHNTVIQFLLAKYKKEINDDISRDKLVKCLFKIIKSSVITKRFTLTDLFKLKTLCYHFAL